jgi:hypothetical protein
MGEGNYWGDYTGVDDGSNGRIAGDGVGDTEIPHPVIDQGNGYFQLDNYPLLDFVRGGIYLHEGWNLISIPTVQSDTNLETVLSPISGAYQAVRWYDGTDTADPWKHNHTQKAPYLNDLHVLNHTMGFWIYINKTGGVLFRYYGIEPSSNQTIPLHPGWNLVGYPSLSNRIRPDALNNIDFGSDVNAVWTYKASMRKWVEIGPIDYFELGMGYWIHSKVSKTWDVPL